MAGRPKGQTSADVARARYVKHIARAEKLEAEAVLARREAAFELEKFELRGGDLAKLGFFPAAPEDEDL